MATYEHIPTALFQSKAAFNPYQYLPFLKAFRYDEVQGRWVWDGTTNLFITDEVGVGKTFEAGILLKQLVRDRRLRVLIVCPVKLCQNWQEELSENFGLNFINGKALSAKLQGVCRSQLTILPYSYFTGWKDGETPPRPIPVYDVLILDEVHSLRNGGAQYRAIRTMIGQNEPTGAPTKLKVLMSATPIFNRTKDYQNLTGLFQNQAYETTATLQGQANCYDHQLTIHLQEVDLNSTEQEIVDELYSCVETMDGDLRSKYHQLTGILKVLSASSLYTLTQFVRDRWDFFENEDYAEAEDLPYGEEWDENLTVLCDRWDPEEDSKYRALSELLQKLRQQDLEKGRSGPFKAVLFSRFLNTCDYLRSRLQGDYEVLLLTGRTSAKLLPEIVNAFRTTNRPALLICSDAAREGQNLQFCHYLIHYDFPYTPAALGQRNGRIYRRGQTTPPEVYYMAVRDSYDDRLFGEIIVSKARIIRDQAQKGRVSLLNVLPEDAEDFLERSIRAVFENRVRETELEDRSSQARRPQTADDLSEAVARLLPPEQRVFRSMLQAACCEGRGSKGSWAKINLTISGQTKYAKGWFDHPPQPEDCCALLCQLFSQKNRDTGELLLEAYQTAFRQILGQVDTAFFGEGDGDSRAFRAHCDAYLRRQIALAKSLGVEDVGRWEDRKFCHSIFGEADCDLQAYREQFQSLYGLQQAIRRALQEGGNRHEYA